MPYFKTSYEQEFDDLYMYLKSKYPKEVWNQEGIGEQTDLGKFSKKFFETEITTTADVSVDANSNVDDMTVVAYENELAKPSTRLNSLYLLWKYARKLYDTKVANDIVERELAGDYYINDMSNVQKPYSYDGDTLICVKCEGKIQYMTMRELFEKYQSRVIKLEDREQINLRDVEISVMDSGKFVSLLYSIRHKTNKYMVCIETGDGRFLYVTSDHPVILADGTEVEARHIKVGDTLATGYTGFEFDTKSVDKVIYSLINACSTGADTEALCSLLVPIYDKLLKAVTTVVGEGEEEVVLDLDVASYKFAQQICEAFNICGVSCGIYVNNAGDGYNVKATFNTPVDNKVKAINTRVCTDEFVYDITTSTGTFYSNGLKCHNCYNFSTYDVMTKGLPFVNKIASRPPKHLSSFCGQMVHFTSYASNQVMGAVGLADLLIVMSYYVKKELDTLPTNPDYVWTFVKQELQNLIYSMNQPFRGGLQSGFYNVSVYDSYFLDTLIPDYIFPDGTTPDKALVQKIQDIFLDLMNETMRISPITFPVTTANFCIDEDNNILDKDFLEYIAKKNQEWCFINIYAGNTATLSSCCFEGSQPAIIRVNGTVHYMPLKEIFDMVDDSDMETLYDGRWVKARHTQASTKSNLYKITLVNGKTMTVTKDHLHPTINGVLPSSELTTDDYIEVNTKSVEGTQSNGVKLDYESGYNLATCVAKNLNYCLMDKYTVKDSNGQRCFAPSCLNESIIFRSAIVDVINQSGNDKRKYVRTYSKQYVESIEMLLTSLGRISFIEKDGEEYVITWDKTDYDGEIRKCDNKTYIKIQSIEQVENNEKMFVYCFEMDDKDKPYFVLPNGIVTHNCRLRSNKDNMYLGYSNSFGSGGTQIGSFGVVTVNLPRIAIKAKGNYDKFMELLDDTVELAIKINHVKRYILKKRIDCGALPLYTHGFMNLQKQYATVNRITRRHITLPSRQWGHKCG